LSALWQQFKGKREHMRQKYLISRETVKNKLNIREYANLQKVLKKTAFSMPVEEPYSFLGEETYDSKLIVNAIQKGMDTLVETLRTHNLFPIWPHAIKIAESVMSLYDSEENQSVELLFDDVDLFDKAPLESG
jgi:hypothetical protein